MHCGGRRGLGSALAGAIRLAALAGGLALAGWLLVSGAPAVKDGIVRNETVRRVKDKVGVVGGQGEYSNVAQQCFQVRGIQG